MQKTKNLELDKKALSLAIVLGLATFIAATQFVHAEEETSAVVTSEVVDEASDTDDIDAKKAAMKAQIESLRKMIEERKAQLKAKQEVVQEERKEAVVEWKQSQAEAKAEFLASLEGLSLEQKKVAILEYITKLKAAIEAKKTEVQENKKAVVEAVQERKTERVEDREAFQASLEGMTPQEKYAAIMERVAALKSTLADRIAEETDDSDEEEDEDEDEADEETTI